MKEIIFIFLVSHAFSVYYLEKGESLKILNRTTEGIVYLNADNFGKNDTIHIQLYCFNSVFYDQIYYEFSDNIPSDEFEPSIKKEPDNYDYSTINEDGEFWTKNVYDIKKDVSAKYLIIKYVCRYYSDSKGFIEIANTLINWILFEYILFICIFGGFFLTICIVFCFKYFTHDNKNVVDPEDDPIITTELQKTNNTPNTPQENDIYYEPPEVNTPKE